MTLVHGEKPAKTGEKGCMQIAWPAHTGCLERPYACLFPAQYTWPCTAIYVVHMMPGCWLPDSCLLLGFQMTATL